jgi:2,3-bisphosphoglycerate-dependent phosphoglycerate mutase
VRGFDVLIIFFEPHAASVDNEAGLASGHHDAELSERGREQASRDKRPKLLPLGVAHVYTSDTRRAYETARIVWGGTGTPITQDPRLRECDYGDMTRRARGVVFEARGDAVDKPFPNGESYSQVVERVKSFLDEATTRHRDAGVFIVGHFATLVALEYLLNGKPIRETFKLNYNEVGFPLTYTVDEDNWSQRLHG